MCSRHEAGANDSDVEVVCHAADAEPGKRTHWTDFADWSAAAACNSQKADARGARRPLLYRSPLRILHIFAFCTHATAAVSTEPLWHS